MAINRQKKEAFVALYSEKLKRCEAAYLTDYRGLDVAAISDLRTQLRAETDAELAVAKNTLFRIALEEVGWAVPTEHLVGPTAVLFCFKDPITPAKVLTRYVKKNDDITIKGGVMRQHVMSEEDVQSMTELPSREEILGALVGVLQAPARELVMTLRAPSQELFGTISAPLRELTQVLHARSEATEAAES